MPKHLIFVAALVVAVGILVAFQLFSNHSTENSLQDPNVDTINVASAGFTDERMCIECHHQQFEDWTDSHHDWAMKKADDQSVLGDFNDTTFTHHGVTSRFFMKDGTHFVNTEGQDGAMADFEITHTFGVEPLQQYLIPFHGGRLQGLTIAWDTTEKRWFHLYPHEQISHDDPLHWTGRYQNWNSRCASCHSTNLTRGYDLETDTYRTTSAVTNVSCQACHGPGQTHVEWARKKNDDGYLEGASVKGTKGLLVNFKGDNPETQLNVCAQCHSRRYEIVDRYEHGKPLMDNLVPALLTEDLYFPDGQIREEVYVFGSFVQSKMHRQGVRCTDCHQPHTAKLVAQDNNLCVRCHQSEPPSRFPTLKRKIYDTPAHHFHEKDSLGSLCVECHMPSRTYMVIDPRRDHSFRIPRPDLSVEFRTPNACTICHDDKSASWAAERVAEWYVPKQDEGPHFAAIIAAGRAGMSSAGSALVDLATDRDHPAIIRATALDLLAQYDDIGTLAMVQSLGDSDALVRATAVRGLETRPPKPRLSFVGPLLEDPVRAVRIEAARVLSDVPAELSDVAQREAFQAALAEWKATQQAIIDEPSAHLNLAVMHMKQRNPAGAEEEYHAALRLDPDFLPARFNLAGLYNGLGRNDEAEQQLRQILVQLPDNGEAHYSLGLLFAETERLEESVTMLGRAAKLLPHRARVQYNYALALQHLNRRPEAEKALFAAYRIEGANPDILQALAIFYVQQEDWNDALPYAEALIKLVPDAPGPQQLLQHIQEQLSNKEI